jgi:heterodisulfide reductase subunit B
MNLDLRQSQIEKASGINYNIPVFYYTQLLGVALGLPEKEIGLEKLVVSPARALEKMQG